MKTSKEKKSFSSALRNYTVFLSVAILLLLQGEALAEGDEETSISRLSSEVLDILIPVLVAFVGAFATWALNKLQKKMGIELSANTIATWSNLAETAADRAGEWARKKSKDLTDGKKVPGPEVMEVAANWAIDMGKQLKLPQIGREKLEGLIEARLFNLRDES